MKKAENYVTANSKDRNDFSGRSRQILS